MEASVAKPRASGAERRTGRRRRWLVPSPTQRYDKKEKEDLRSNGEADAWVRHRPTQ